MSNGAPRQEGRRWRLTRQLPLLVVLVILWMLLWGSASWLTITTGIVLAVLVTRGLYLPPVELAGRFNPIRFVIFLGIFLFELVVASFQVAGRAFAPHPVPTNAVVAVQLRTRSDFLMTLTAISVSLIPGSLIIEVDRDHSILYLHALGTSGPDDIAEVRRSVLAIEARLVRSLGSSEDVRKLDAEAAS